MKLACNVISILVLIAGAALYGVPGFQAVSPTASTSPSSSSSHKSQHSSATATHHKATHHTGTHTASTASHHKHSSTPSQTGDKAGHKTAHHKAPVHHSTAYTRLAHMQMEPARVESIQQALIGAGDMRGTPTGRWDTETREAMARYQTDNGFGVTGLPDAKSLMKLGLGPHPLPPQLDKTRAPGSAPATGDAAALPTNPAPQPPGAPSVEPSTFAPPAATGPPLGR